MISIEGRLMIKIINGRNGPFRVGSLLSDIGEFAVKDKILDQYDEGSYRGLFTISKIFSSTYSTGSRLVVEVRAVLENISLANVDAIEPEQHESLEQDPLDEEKDENLEVTKPDHSIEPTDSDGLIEPIDSEDEDHNDLTPEELSDKKLFGLLWPLQDSFKLDPTVSRVTFREQRERLKSLNYKFNPIGQYWTKT
jgi:hypothetical protein